MARTSHIKPKASEVRPSSSEHQAAMRDYMQEGEALAVKLGNRGPLRLTRDGALHPEIQERYQKHGYYIFENLLQQKELQDLRAGVEMMLERAPVHRGAKLDAQGRPALSMGFERDTYTWIAPLTDPVGGTSRNGGRHPVKMLEPLPTRDAPSEVIYMMFGMCQTMDAGLRLYGHPELLAVAASLNGPDFTPFTEAIFVKQPGLGGSVAWHQDGLTHWQSPHWDANIHGFNFQAQLYPCTLGNCLWVLPGSHTRGKIDIRAMVEANNQSEMLPGAVPLFCNAGDVTLVNRQTAHCSFANTSEDLRISLTFGFHKKSSVLGASGVLGAKDADLYDEDRIFSRSRVIAVAIDARAQRYPEETRFIYEPFRGLEDQYRFKPRVWDDVVRNYNVQDLGI